MAEPEQVFDLIVRGGQVFDGGGGEPRVADIGVTGDRISSIGRLEEARAQVEIDASGMAVAPGFINMLSHSYITMLQDGRSLSELKQGVTLQVFGEGHSMGPLTPRMRERLQKNLAEGPMPVEVAWTTLGEYLRHAEGCGISQNIASYIGATTLRINAVGQDDRPATEQELDRMCGLVRQEMEAGALGIGSSLIYPPAFFASTEELVALCAAAAPYGGRYISHMRDEGNALIEAVEELLRISRQGGVPAETYHLKASGRENWHKLGRVIELVEDARAGGEAITADVYTYTAGGTGLSNAIPPWFHDGGPTRLLERLEDASVCREIRAAIEGDGAGWDNLYRASGGAEGILIVGVRKPGNRQYQGKTLATVAAAMGLDPIDGLMELVRRDRSRIDTLYFIISEENLRRELRLPWVSLGSDASSVAAEGAFLDVSTHPRAYGTFARFLGKYVRDEALVPLPEAIRRLTALPAANLGLRDRGRLMEGYYADLVVFDPAAVADKATYQLPHQYAVGVRDVVVNGVMALGNGEATGALPGRAVFGPGSH